MLFILRLYLIETVSTEARIANILTSYDIKGCEYLCKTVPLFFQRLFITFLYKMSGY